VICANESELKFHSKRRQFSPHPKYTNTHINKHPSIKHTHGSTAVLSTHNHHHTSECWLERDGQRVVDQCFFRLTTIIRVILFSFRSFRSPALAVACRTVRTSWAVLACSVHSACWRNSRFIRVAHDRLLCSSYSTVLLLCSDYLRLSVCTKRPGRLSLVLAQCQPKNFQVFFSLQYCSTLYEDE
jgi:hypothetical protein